MTTEHPLPVEAAALKVASKHDHRVRTHSANPELITDTLRRYVSGPDTSLALIESVCATWGIPAPEVRFNARRRPITGYTLKPRSTLASLYGLRPTDRLHPTHRLHRKHRFTTVADAPQHGRIQLGTTTYLEVVAHELGHHGVNYREPLNTPGHGKVWVAHYDRAAALVAALCGLSGADIHDLHAA